MQTVKKIQNKNSLDETQANDVKSERARKLRSLRVNAGQSSALTTQFIGLFDDLFNENLMFRDEIEMLKKQIRAITGNKA